jgi:hypothetical protein
VYVGGDRAIERQRQSVRKNLREICREYFGFKLEDFHVEALELMFQGGRLVINWPTDHAKSTVGTFLFPLLSLMEDPDASHIICGANINDSKRRVKMLQLEIETNQGLQREWPWVTKPEGRDQRLWSTTQFNIAGRTINKPNPSVYAAAVGSSDIKGRRGKLIMDDIEGEEVRWSPLKRQQLHSWLKLEAWRCFEDRKESSRPLLCAMGTPFDVDSIYFRMEAEGWTVHRRPVYLRTYRDQWGREQHDYLWPEKAAKVEQARKALNKLEFSVAYLMDPTGGDDSRLSAVQIQEWMTQASTDAPDWKVFVSIDPASGSQRRRADYAGIAVVKVAWLADWELPLVQVLEAHAFRLGLFEQVHLASRLAAAYQAPVIYEGNSQQGMVYQNTFAHLHPEVRLVRHYTTHENKFDTKMGLTVVKTLVTHQRLHVSESQLESAGIQALIQEIRDLHPPFDRHNHIAAAIWFVIRHLYDQVRIYNGPKIVSNYPLRPNGWRPWNPYQKYWQVLRVG